VGKFPVDAPKQKVVRAFESLGFRIVREKEHISMLRENPDGSKTRLTMPESSQAKSFDASSDLHPSRHSQGRILGGL
jgi:hypothetical protein